MGGPIYKIFLNRYRDPWYQLSEAEQRSFGEKHVEAFKALGINIIVLCDTGWSSEEWDFCGVTEFPDIEAVQQLRQLQEEWGWYRYIDSKVVMGTKFEM